MKPLKSLAMLSASLMLMVMVGAQSMRADTGSPDPVLYLKGLDYYSTRSGNFVRYEYDVLNKASYPPALFQAAPSLPPCGNNTSSSRSWVDFFEGTTNRRLYGFCALGNPSQLSQIWFALPEGQVPPSYIYIEIVDRQTNTRYRSNLADTVM